MSVTIASTRRTRRMADNDENIVLDEELDDETLRDGNDG